MQFTQQLNISCLQSASESNHRSQLPLKLTNRPSSPFSRIQKLFTFNTAIKEVRDITEGKCHHCSFWLIHHSAGRNHLCLGHHYLLQKLNGISSIINIDSFAFSYVYNFLYVKNQVVMSCYSPVCLVCENIANTISESPESNTKPRRA